MTLVTHTLHTVGALLHTGNPVPCAFARDTWQALLDARFVEHKKGFEWLNPEFGNGLWDAYDFTLTDAGKAEVERILTRKDCGDTVTYLVAQLEAKVSLWRERALKTNQACEELRSRLGIEKETRAALQAERDRVRRDDAEVNRRVEHLREALRKIRGERDELAAMLAKIRELAAAQQHGRKA